MYLKQNLYTFAFFFFLMQRTLLDGVYTHLQAQFYRFQAQEPQDSTSHWRSSFQGYVIALRKGRWTHRELCHQGPRSPVLPNQVNRGKGDSRARAQVQQIREVLRHSVKGKTEVLCKSDGEILKTQTMTPPLTACHVKAKYLSELCNQEKSRWSPVIAISIWQNLKGQKGLFKKTKNKT